MDIQMSLKELAKKNPHLKFRIDPEMRTVNILRGVVAKSRPEAEALQSAGIEFVRAHKELFGKVDFHKVKKINESKDYNGGLSVTLQQYFGDYRVLGGSIRFHADCEGNVDVVSNHLLPDLEALPHRPEIHENEAIKLAQKKCGDRGELVNKPELLVHRYHGIVRLAWHVMFNGKKTGEHGAPSQWSVFVDATDGDVYFYYDNIQTAGPAVGAGTGYYSSPGAINAWDNDTMFELRDTTRVVGGGAEITTNDDDGTSPSSDADNNWSTLITAPRDQNQGAEVDAHKFAAQVYDYFNTIHGRNSFDDAGATMITDVHYGTNFNNGFWDGSHVRLGDGDGVSWDYMCSDDWLAHEYTHAYTQYTCGLIYNGEPGALNEAISDTFAAFITGDWLVFEDTWLQVTAPAARNMIDPTNGGNWDNSSDAAAIASVIAGHQPSHYNDRYTGATDNGGVHINSGIINHLFYLLTVGGTHAISGVTVTGIGQSAAEQLLWRCVSVNLVGNPSASFVEFREEMMNACLELFPTDLNILTQTKRAFNAVGIGPDLYVRDNLSDSGEEPFAGAYLWASPDIINRQSLSANPSLDFADLNDDALWENVEAGQDNYVYVRVQNRGNEAGDITVNVYFSSATTFGTPASWMHIGTMMEAGVLPGSLRIAGPLTFSSAQIPAPGHYCMIAVITSSVDPAPDHTLITTVSDYLDFVRSSNNIAYRNMNVVDLIPGSPGVTAVEVQPMPHLRERFDLRLDTARFVPGARLRIRGPANPLDGAQLLGMKLIAREQGENIYELQPARNHLKQRMFMWRSKQSIGFDHVLVDKPFVLKLEWMLPEDNNILRRMTQQEYRIGIRQQWQDKDIGAAYVRLIQPHKRLPEVELFEEKPAIEIVQKSRKKPQTKH